MWLQSLPLQKLAQSLSEFSPAQAAEAGAAGAAGGAITGGVMRGIFGG